MPRQTVKLGILLIGLMIFTILPVVSAQWGPANNPGWGYRRKITITNPGSPLTDYQIKLHLTDTSNMKADGADLRFTDLDNTILYSHWVQSWATNDAYVWVKISSIPNGDSYMWMWYGNPDANSVSDGDNTFLFFDDFTGTSIDTSKWTLTSGTPVVANSKVELQNNDLISTNVLTATDPSYAWDYDFQGTQANIGGAISYRILIVNGGGDFYAQYIDFDTTPTYDFILRRRDNNVGNSIINANWELDTNRHEVTVTRLTGGSWQIFYDGASKGTINDNTYTQLNRMEIVTGWGYPGTVYMEVTGWGYPGTVYMDTFRVRNFASPEPTTSLGSSEYSPPYPVGGIVSPIDKINILTPYLILLILIGITVTLLTKLRRV